MIVLLDNGHGIDTPGKRSPKWDDGSQLFEYEFNRDIVNRIAAKLAIEGITYHILVPEIEDVSLPERCKRANAFGSEAILISVHANAGGGTGFEVFTSRGQTKADPLATIMYEEFVKEFPELRGRKDLTDGDPDKESQFYILRNTSMPAMLTENFFMDNKVDCKLLMDVRIRRRIAEFHVQAIKRMLS